MKELSGQIAIVTGAASGIGLGISKGLAEEGATVYLLDRDKEKLECAAAYFQERKLLFETIPIDITDEIRVKSCIEKIVTVYGRIDVLINNAGRQYISLVQDFPTEEFESMLKLMLTSPFFIMKQVIPIMRSNKYGRIINMASVNGLIGFAGKAAYNSAKHGLIGLTKVAALETAAEGITVNAICPGYVDTALVRNQLEQLARQRNIEVQSVLESVIYPLVPQRRLLQVKEIVSYVKFIASPKASGVTGQAVVIDGGYTTQ
ncbi:3-hydroxybutyrate dehydrogenase [Sphingobacterium faecale]|uniref:3-hydroxybutyrate dehydrogenase n=1 Tax=Sphingobacterium faecale TaxID=2803775 RepID=A0ABS1R3V4_9SPHI|nr:3-hydroxybutyrate dehydrogenase [Sphingobacterium faecale]MBL1409396.1 3-hydroxybutyrate dehydrogenase [Sphingobacterium faecale]